MAEEIELKFKGDDASFDELDRRFAALADKAAQRLGRALAGAAGGVGGPGGAGAVGSGEGGSPKAAPIPSLDFSGVPKAIGGWGGFAAQAALAGAQGAGAEIRSLPTAALGTGAETTLGTLGAAKGVLGATIGQVPLAGDLVMARFNALEQAIRQPAERAAAVVGGIAEQYGRAGVRLSDADLSYMAQTRLAVEERAYVANQRGQKAVFEAQYGGSLFSGTSVLSGLSRLGN